jgi:hypothetical protein
VNMTVKDMIAVMQASLEGKQIQAKPPCGEWRDIQLFRLTWNWCDLTYRVKPTQPEEFYVNIYADGTIGRAWRCKDAARQSQDIGRKPIRTVHVREVLP